MSQQPSTNSLNPEAIFALKLMGTYAKTSTSTTIRLPNGGSSGNGGHGSNNKINIINTVKSELLDMVRNNQTTAVHVQRLCTCYFGESAKNNPDFEITGRLVVILILIVLIVLSYSDRPSSD